MQDCLILDAAYRPIGFIHWQRAIKLYWEGSVDIVAEDESGKVVRSPSTEMAIPRVVRIKNYVAKVRKKGLAPSRQNIAIRDNYECQYCGEELDHRDDQTLDHILPRSRGGKNTWQNLVLCCHTCNFKKGDKTPQEAGMVLRNLPVEPKANSNYQYTNRVRPEWKPWIEKGFLY